MFLVLIMKQLSSKLASFPILQKDDVIRMLHRSYYVDNYCIASKREREIPNKEQEESETLLGIPLDLLPENRIAHVRQALEDIQAGKYYGEFGW